MEAERLRKQAAAFRYDLNLAQTFTIDLRPFANSLYWDNTAGDGKGGWTDQGKDNSLDSVPWDPEVLLGVPCDFIRFDMNGDKSCIILHSKSVKIPRPSAVNDIPVNAKVSRLFFFHTAAWVGNDTPVMTYRIRYASGRTVDIPVVAGRNIGNWWISYAPPSLRKHIAWKNMDGKGIYLYCWENPDPSEEVRSIDLLSANNESVGIVIGITAERFVPGQPYPGRHRQNRRVGRCQTPSGKRHGLCGYRQRFEKLGGCRHRVSHRHPGCGAEGQDVEIRDERR